MASTSAIEYIANPTVVEVIKRPRPVFQLVPEIAKKDDTLGAFSQIPKGVVYAKDPRMYIHYNIEELGDEEIKTMYKIVICDDTGNVKAEHKVIETLGFIEILSIPEFPKDVIRIVLSRVHGEFFWLDAIHKITKEAVKAVIGLPTTGKRPDKTKKVPNDLVTKITGATFDKRSLRVNDVKDINVRFISYKELGYDILVRKQLTQLFNTMGENKEKNIHDFFQALKTKMKQRIRLSQKIVDKYKDDICFVIKKDEIWMEVVIPRTIWVTEMGYETDDHIVETYAKALLEAPNEPKEEVFGSAETIESQIQSKKRVKKVEAFVRKESRQAKAIKEDVLKKTGITEDELAAPQPEAHLSLVGTSSEDDMPTTFKRVVRKRDPSPATTPSPRRTRQKQQAVRSPVRKVTPKKS
ncbi:hypothetical protein SUGI_1173840 [Cryptomeria japonica]|nr:hypothetical protein SUGI_1173840 [Cryptomeria japonica]